MSALTKELLEQAERGTIAAFRYLAFLSQERRQLVEELYPELGEGNTFFVPADLQVGRLINGTPLTRAETVLRALKIDPFIDDDLWVGDLTGKGPVAKPRRD